MGDLPRAAVERLIRNAGAKRVSASAAEALAEVLEDVAMDIAAEATLLAKHAGRKTVTAKDIKLAAKT
ncbi:MAG: NFYB/HAP3 family transcription factor subunit [Candidatus Diapherotrites archaeon]|nr:NFYB/HAP3 family transcription factor subunit [Candidatus Diapherotrites archaeon]